MPEVIQRAITNHISIMKNCINNKKLLFIIQPILLFEGAEVGEEVGAVVVLQDEDHSFSVRRSGAMIL